jgi:rhamnose transport system permease protein
MIARLIRRPEMVTILLLAAAIPVSASLSPYFLNLQNLLEASTQYTDMWVLALAMTLIIISGNIDLSVASGLALTAVVSAWLHVRGGVPMPWVMLIAILLGMSLGLFNGLLVTKLRLPSLTVTLGTLALYRGLAQVMTSDRPISGLPQWFVGIDYVWIGGVPVTLLIFVLLAVAFALLLHQTTFGRCVYALGTNEMAARFSGVRTDAVKLGVFVLSGLMMGVGAVMMLSRLGSASHGMAMGDELAVITAVVLGGTDIFGGRGSVTGTVLALLLLGLIRQGMVLDNIRAENQLAVMGGLLIIAVILTNLTSRLGRRN